jgi:hypothetical protein
MRLNGLIFLGTLLLLSALTLSGTAQDIGTEGIFQTALATTTKNCEGLRRNEACYGHALLTAAPYPGVEEFNFDNEGDRVSLAATQSIKLSGLDAETGTWGVVLMHLRANLPSSRPENVTLVAFGDVELTNAVKPSTYARIQVRTRENVNVRYYPSLQARVIGTLESDQVVTAVERVADSSWLRVQMPNSDETGWVFTELMTIIDDVEILNISEFPLDYYEPMQAFYFRSGSDNPDFTAVPESGLLIQTPEGVGEVQLLINEINIQLGSTVFFQAQPDGVMAISTLEGHADVSVGGEEQTAFGGTTVTVPVDENLAPKGPPSAPKPYDEDKMKRLPLDSLERKVVVQPARTEEEITQLIENHAANPGSDNASPGAPTQTPLAEVTPEVTPEIVPSVEVTLEITSEIVPTQPDVFESTPGITPTETGDYGEQSESTPEAQSDAEDSGETESTPDVQAEQNQGSSNQSDHGSESTPESRPEQTGGTQGESAEDSPEVTPEPEPV